MAQKLLKRLSLCQKNPEVSYSETHATVATGENFEVFRDTFLTVF